MRFYQTVLKFENTEIQSLMGKTLNDDSDDRVSVDEGTDEAFAIDPLSILLVIALEEAIKYVTVETLKFLFEKLKNLLSKNKSAIKQKEVAVNIKVKDKKFTFLYDTVTETYTVTETE